MAVNINLNNVAEANPTTNYTTPLDADKVGIWDTANSLFKGVTWANIKATLKAYFDTLYKPTFSENTAFNKNFGTTAGTVLEGNDSRLSSSIHTTLSVSLNPADGTTYYSVIIGGLPQVSIGSAGMRFLRTGTITDFNIFACYVVNGSGESTSIYLRNVTTATDYLITSAWLENYGASTFKNQSYTGLSIPVGNTTDLWNIKIVYQTFATNPTNVQYSWGILLK